MTSTHIMWAVIGGLFVMFALPFLTGLVAGRKGA
jgi:hypothetical protein